MAYTTEEQDYRDELHQIISDVYKSLHGVRPRLDFSDMSIEGMQKYLEDLDAEVDQAIQEDRKAAEQARQQFEEAIQNTIDAGAKNRATALRWLMEDEDDVDRVLYEMRLLDLPYPERLALRAELEAAMQ